MMGAIVDNEQFRKLQVLPQGKGSFSENSENYTFYLKEQARCCVYFADPVSIDSSTVGHVFDCILRSEGCKSIEIF